MMKIELTKGHSTIIDDADADLAEHKWHALTCGGKHTRSSERYVYAVRKYNGAVMLLHRVILERKIGHSLPKHIHTDHINRNTLDNRRGNLRMATRSQNISNSKPRSDRTAPYRGIELRDSGKWRARISIGGAMKHIGTFDTPEEAAQAWNEEAKARSGEFARLNTIPG